MNRKTGGDSTNRKMRIRRANGETIAEFGPALFILLICIFFPLIDILAMCVSYGLCVVLNTNQVKEAALLTGSSANSNSDIVKQGIPDEWANGMGRFVKMAEPVNTQIAYRTGETGTDQTTDTIVGVRTTVKCSPFLPVPVPFVTCPGLNAPMTFQITSERPMENPDFAKE